MGAAGLNSGSIGIEVSGSAPAVSVRYFQPRHLAALGHVKSEIRGGFLVSGVEQYQQGECKSGWEDRDRTGPYGQARLAEKWSITRDDDGNDTTWRTVRQLRRGHGGPIFASGHSGED
jgi:hypothetical protein